MDLFDKSRTAAHVIRTELTVSEFIFTFQKIQDLQKIKVVHFK